MGKVIDLFGQRTSDGQSYGREMFELEAAANELCEGVWHMMVPMGRLRIKELTIDSSGIILNIRYKDESNDENNPH